MIALKRNSITPASRVVMEDMDVNRSPPGEGKDVGITYVMASPYSVSEKLPQHLIFTQGAEK